MKKIVLGVDIGGTNSRLGFVDEQGAVLAKAKMETLPHEGPEALWSRIWLEAQRLWQDEVPSVKTLSGCWSAIGIGAPNAHGGRGFIEYPPNLGWAVVDFLGIVRRYTDLPVWLGNDANLAALGEGRFGAAAGQQNFLLVTLGTGLGSGLVVNGSLVEGDSGFSAELGHITLEEGGRQCGCGRRGCLETYASANGLRRTVLELLAEGAYSSRLGDLSFAALTSEQIFQAAELGDQLAQVALKRTATYLARGLATVVHLCSPRSIYIGGGLSLSGDWLMKPLPEQLERNLMPVFRGTVAVALAQLAEADLGILGAAALALSSLEGIERK